MFEMGSGWCGFFSEIVVDYRLWTEDIAMLHSIEDDVLVLVISYELDLLIEFSCTWCTKGHVCS